MALLLGVLPASVARAQEGPAPDGPPAAQAGSEQPENIEAAREARVHFQTGMEHFDARRFRPAIREFQLAAQLVPSADLWFNIARAHEELSEHEQAVEYYRRYLRDRVDPPDRERVEQHIGNLEERAEAARRARRHAPTTGTLRIRSSVEGSLVSVDGRELGRAPIAAPLSLPPGRHRLSVREEGYVPFESEVQVEAGVTTAAYADLEPATDYRAVRGGRLFTWITAGLGVVALGTSIYFGARAASLSGDAGDATTMAEQEAFLDDARGWAARSDYALGGAIVLGIGSVVLWFIEGSSVSTERVSGAE